MFKLTRILLLATCAAGAATPAMAKMSADQAQILAELRGISTAYAKGDAVGAMAPYLPTANFVIFDVMQPPEQHGYANSLQVTRQVIAGAAKPVMLDYQNPTIVVDGDHAYSYDLVHMVATMKSGDKTDMIIRNSDVWQRIHGKWLIVFEHNSVPMTTSVSTAQMNVASGSGAP